MAREMSDEQFEKRTNALVEEYARIIKAGFPEEKLVKWHEKLDKLPPNAQKIVRDMVEMPNILRNALMGRERPGDFQWETEAEQSARIRAMLDAKKAEKSTGASR